MDLKTQRKIKKKMYRDRTGLYIESQLKDTDYLVKEGHIITLADRNGVLAIDFQNLDTFIEELQGIKEIYGT